MNPQQNPTPPPTDPTQQTQGPTMSNPLAVMRPGEKVLFEVKRHPIGILFMYSVAAAILLAMAIILFVALPSMSADNKSQITNLGIIVFVVAAILTVAFTFIAQIVYWGNQWILTDDSITQIKQTSLFNKQSSQLSLENLEDITAEQNGILPHMFGYGTVKAETAGEHSKFIFPYCSDPNKYAQMILQARETFNMGREERERGTNVNTQ